MVSYCPKSLKEALRVRRDEEVSVYAGGTEWMLNRANREKNILFLGNITGLKVIAEDDKGVYIGAGCTLTELLESSMVPALLKQAISKIASPAIRNVATIGGCICSASPSGDCLPVLYAVDCMLAVSSVDTTEIVGIEEFIVGARAIRLNHDELLEQIILPKQGNAVTFFKKVMTRNINCMSKVSFAGIMRFKEDRVEKMAIAIGATGSTVIRSKLVEGQMVGKGLQECTHVKERVLNDYSRIIKPITDYRASAAYRKKVLMNLMELFFIRCGI